MWLPIRKGGRQQRRNSVTSWSLKTRLISHNSFWCLLSFMPLFLPFLFFTTFSSFFPAILSMQTHAAGFVLFPYTVARDCRRKCLDTFSPIKCWHCSQFFPITRVEILNVRLATVNWCLPSTFPYIRQWAENRLRNKCITANFTPNIIYFMFWFF